MDDEKKWLVESPTGKEALIYRGDELELDLIAGDVFALDELISDANAGAMNNKATEAIRYWREHCTGCEPSISQFEILVDKALGLYKEPTE